MSSNPVVLLRHPPPSPLPVEASLVYPPTETRRSLAGIVNRSALQTAAVVGDIVTSPVQAVFWTYFVLTLEFAN
ncbi:MAG: hypothetical protein AAF561_05035 [Planctomycetota bacterium]